MPANLLIGEWTVAPACNLLVRGDEELRVEPRLMDVLVLLAERADQLVTKDDLIERVWKTRYVTDDVVTVTIYALRKALGDDARRPQYIETVSRRGYRLIAPVRLSTAAVAEIPAVAPAPLEAAQSRHRYSSPHLAAAVALALLATSAVWMVAASRSRRHVPAAEAYDAYIKGRHFLDQRSIRSWRQALEQFERAAALDPRYPAAQAGLADTYAAMSDFGVASPAEMRPRAERAARRALELDGQSAEGEEALGRVVFLFDWNFAEAHRRLSRATALDPEYMPAHQAMAWVESARGHHRDAIAAAHRALQLDPVTPARYTELAWVLALGGRHAEAMREVERALQLNAQSFESHLMKGWIFEQLGKPDAAFAAYRDAQRFGGAPEDALRSIDAAYRAEGLPGYYRGWLERSGGTGIISETSRARLYMEVGQLDRALEH